MGLRETRDSQPNLMINRLLRTKEGVVTDDLVFCFG